MGNDEDRRDDGEDYVTVNVDIMVAPVGGKAVKVRCADDTIIWLPRSCMFGPDEKKIASMAGQLMPLKIFRWLAVKNGIPMARKP